VTDLKRNTFLAVMLYLLLCVTGCGGNMQSKNTGNTQSSASGWWKGCLPYSLRTATRSLWWWGRCGRRGRNVINL